MKSLQQRVKVFPIFITDIRKLRVRLFHSLELLMKKTRTFLGKILKVKTKNCAI